MHFVPNFAVLSFPMEAILMNSDPSVAIVQEVTTDLFIGITPSNHAVAIDTDHVRCSAPSPMELLLIALGSCTAVDVATILRKKRQHVEDYRVEVRGFRRDEHPRSYERLEVHHIVTGRSISEQSVAQAIELSETKYCSVAATFRPTVEIVSTFQVIQVEVD
jgi:putative redox protein